jgi:sugar phosphate isomerase/epimerase
MTDFSYQLYSSRNFPPLSATLRMLGEAGYAQVEGYGALFGEGTDLGALKADLDAAGLSMPTAHVGLDVIRAKPARAIEIARALGVEAVFAPHLAAPDRPTDARGWTAFGTSLGEALKPLQDAGLITGWHNHDFEFARMGGVLPQDLILGAAPDISVELDVAWCVKGGEDPLAWIAANSDRIVAAHVKDIAPKGKNADEDGWADVGEGIVDWPSVMAALRKTPCRWFIAEHDNPSDHKRFATRSIAAMRGL